MTSGLGIYDTMRYIKPPIATWCVGQACSMASLLLCSGQPGMRHSLPNARIMIHQPSGQAQGQATDIMIQVARCWEWVELPYGVCGCSINQLCCCYWVNRTNMIFYFEIIRLLLILLSNGYFSLSWIKEDISIVFNYEIITDFYKLTLFLFIFNLFIN